LPKTSTDAGTTISNKPVRKNDITSIPDNLDPVSNVTEESGLHTEKHVQCNTSTDAKITISINPAG
jgi:hypothetical protein